MKLISLKNNLLDQLKAGNALTGQILQDAYQSTASYLYNVYMKDTNSL